jgi:hypothetical protein
MKWMSQLLACGLFLLLVVPKAQGKEYDVVVYGGTSGAVTAAVQAKRLGKTAVIVCPDTHLGGLSSGGLGWTDTGNKAVIGGLAREFYHRVWKHYQTPDAWKWQQRKDYGDKGQGTPAGQSHQARLIFSRSNIASDSLILLHRTIA